MNGTPREDSDPFAALDEPFRGETDLLVIDVDGFEGPLDLLLKLARDQKVDLTKISILALAEQYLAFIDTARRLRLEIAADYLVMAAWLAYLKSRLLLPAEEGEGPSGEELAEVLAQRLRRLEAMRHAGRQLMALPRLGIETFARGMPEAPTIRTDVFWGAALYDLLSSYAALRLHRVVASLRVGERQVFSLQQARERLEALIGASTHWARLDSYLLDYLGRPELRRTAHASALSASLEMVREGGVELQQSAPFAPLFIRRRISARLSLAKVANG